MARALGHGRPGSGRAWGAGAHSEAERARLTWRMLDVAARHGPVHGNCLSQSLCLWLLLRRQGIPSEMRIGVRAEPGQLLAHAWVEHQGQPLNDTLLVRDRYAVFDRPVLPAAARWS